MRNDPSGGGWTEQEVRGAVAAYLDLLRAEQRREATNKAELYRKLSAQFPKRVPKAFELKFQNISAILYELRLPYCSGLKPRFNYQRLLRLVVLDALDRSPLPAIEPHEILFAKLRELAARGPLSVTRAGTGRFGLALEEALGIPQNSDKAADFMGIELKTKSDNSLQTLFSRVPSRFVEDPHKTAMFNRHSRVDEKRNRRALYTSFSARGDSLGFKLAASGQLIQVLRGSTAVLEYDAEAIEEALLSKHSQTAYLAVQRATDGERETCTLRVANYCKWPSIIRFLRFVSAGDVYLDFTLSQTRDGRVRDHGFLWRVPGAILPSLYLSNKVLSL